MTLMLAFWRDIRCQPCEQQGVYGAAMPMPLIAPLSGAAAAPCDTRPAWLDALAPVEPSLDDGTQATSSAPCSSVYKSWRAAQPTNVACVWQPVNGCGKEAVPTYDSCFQGF